MYLVHVKMIGLDRREMIDWLPGNPANLALIPVNPVIPEREVVQDCTMHTLGSIYPFSQDHSRKPYSYPLYPGPHYSFTRRLYPVTQSHITLSLTYFTHIHRATLLILRHRLPFSVRSQYLHTVAQLIPLHPSKQDPIKIAFPTV